MGRGREVILEGGKQPGEERPFDGVNNVVVGERTREISEVDAARQRCAGELKSSEPRGRKVRNGKGDGSIREGRAATSGEKPLKGGCPWTIQSEIWLADPRDESSRGR